MTNIITDFHGSGTGEGIFQNAIDYQDHLDENLIEEIFSLCGVTPERKQHVRLLLEQIGGISAAIRSPKACLRRAGLLNKEIRLLGLLQSTITLILRRSVENRPVLNTLSSVIDYLHADMAYRSTEAFRVLFLNNKLRLLHNEVMGIGSIESVEIHPRSVLSRALEVNSRYVILVHNHPSGDPAPSREDIQITAAVRDAAKLFNIGVLDHIVIASTGHASLQALGML